jgi:acetyltransferase-like isoleucine patch superfamily enzyme
VRHRLQDAPCPISIGDHCWIGINALVLKGVTLGQGTVVAAGSVVGSGEYPPFSLLAGNPARVIRSVPESEVLDADVDLGSVLEEGMSLLDYRP